MVCVWCVCEVYVVCDVCVVCSVYVCGVCTEHAGGRKSCRLLPRHAEMQRAFSVLLYHPLPYSLKTGCP